MSLNKLYLASASPRRAEILKAFDVPFELRANHFDEESVNPNDFSSVKAYVRYLANEKAKSAGHESAWVLAADTIVVLNGRILGKPTDESQAFEYLSQLSQNSHRVLTAFCLYHQGQSKLISQVNSATVTFNSISADDLKAYIRDYKPFDKAGAYGIQEVPKHFIKGFRGSKYTIIGLPIFSVLKRIKHSQLL